MPRKDDASACSAKPLGPEPLVSKGLQLQLHLWDRNPDFRVLDNKRLQKVVLDTVSAPVSLALAVQVNRDVRQYVPFIAKAGAVFESLLIGESGQAAVITYGDDVSTVKPMDAGDLQAALAKLSANGRRARMIDAGLRGVGLLQEGPSARTRILVFVGQSMDDGSKSEERRVG